MKKRDKIQKDVENIKNMNKEDFLHQAKVHSNDHKKGVKEKIHTESQSTLIHT